MSTPSWMKIEAFLEPFAEEVRAATCQPGSQEEWIRMVADIEDARLNVNETIAYHRIRWAIFQILKKFPFMPKEDVFLALGLLLSLPPGTLKAIHDDNDIPQGHLAHVFASPSGERVQEYNPAQRTLHPCL